ncbi:hypothetical protein PPERSA_08708 [Pseudocohnilembus persalinus]|uniref:Uncharacterized protein n=1 Tax=Pseudocohnilembus persalinus TaxID=266149 RepID=A0A0V0R884_PSEPJ|nr:hypothetical protein PPERSA_08708 [Pseudocohnilembus persalinus]|eukprot:KRX10713.1 hypothetical protein PPERSA_08708 [Pseudocohnilembus persalinus]
MIVEQAQNRNMNNSQNNQQINQSQQGESQKEGNKSIEQEIQDKVQKRNNLQVNSQQQKEEDTQKQSEQLPSLDQVNRVSSKKEDSSNNLNLSSSNLQFQQQQHQQQQSQQSQQQSQLQQQQQQQSAGSSSKLSEKIIQKQEETNLISNSNQGFTREDRKLQQLIKHHERKQDDKIKPKRGKRPKNKTISNPASSVQNNSEETSHEIQMDIEQQSQENSFQGITLSQTQNSLQNQQPLQQNMNASNNNNNQGSLNSKGNFMGLQIIDEEKKIEDSMNSIKLNKQNPFVEQQQSHIFFSLFDYYDTEQFRKKNIEEEYKGITFTPKPHCCKHLNKLYQNSLQENISQNQNGEENKQSQENDYSNINFKIHRSNNLKFLFDDVKTQFAQVQNNIMNQNINNNNNKNNQNNINTNADQETQINSFSDPDQKTQNLLLFSNEQNSFIKQYLSDENLKLIQQKAQQQQQQKEKEQLQLKQSQQQQQLQQQQMQISQKSNLYDEPNNSSSNNIQIKSYKSSYQDPKRELNISSNNNNPRSLYIERDRDRDRDYMPFKRDFEKERNWDREKERYQVDKSKKFMKKDNLSFQKR